MYERLGTPVRAYTQIGPRYAPAAHARMAVSQSFPLPSRDQAFQHRILTVVYDIQILLVLSSCLSVKCFVDSCVSAQYKIFF